MQKFTLLLVAVMLNVAVYGQSESLRNTDTADLDWPPEIPADYYLAVFDITQTSAMVDCQLETDVEAKLLEMGLCWGTSPEADTSDNKRAFDRIYIAKEAVMKKLTGLLPNTTYYVKGYTIDSVGIHYSWTEMFTTLPGPDLQNGLLAFYPFDGSTKDESGNNHHGTSNGIIFTKSRFGVSDQAGAYNGEVNTLFFEGTQLAHPFTSITAWIKANNTEDTILVTTLPQTLKMILKIENNHYHLQLKIGAETIVLKDTSQQNYVSSDHPRFDFIAIVYGKDNYIRFMVNNIPAGTVFFDRNLIPFKFPKKIKKNTVFTFRGVLDDVRIYTKALNNEELTTLYNDRISSVPGLSVKGFRNIGTNVAEVFGRIEDDGAGELIDAGICWGTTPNPDTTFRVSNCCEWFNIEVALSSLKAGTTYYVRAYAINYLGVGYSRDSSFRTLPEELNAEESAFRMYPNPASEVLYLPDFSETVTVTIYDSQSRVRLKTKVTDGKVDIASLPKGMYFIHLSDGEKSQKRKFVK